MGSRGTHWSRASLYLDPPLIAVYFHTVRSARWSTNLSIWGASSQCVPNVGQPPKFTKTSWISQSQILYFSFLLHVPGFVSCQLIFSANKQVIPSIACLLEIRSIKHSFQNKFIYIIFVLNETYSYTVSQLTIKWWQAFEIDYFM